jgi:hypothetical protein
MLGLPRLCLRDRHQSRSRHHRSVMSWWRKHLPSDNSEVGVCYGGGGVDGVRIGGGRKASGGSCGAAEKGAYGEWPSRLTWRRKFTAGERGGEGECAGERFQPTVALHALGVNFSV